MEEGGTSLHKTIREINLVYKGLLKEFFEFELDNSGTETARTVSYGSFGLFCLHSCSYVALLS